MASSRQRYEILDASTEETLSRHRTRQAAIDTWRVSFSGRAVRIVRRSNLRQDPGTLIVEGIWHESHRR